MPTLIRVDDEVQLPDRLPVIALRDLVFFPYMVLPLLIGRPRSVAALREAQEGDGLLALVAQRDHAVEHPGPEDLFDVGTAARAIQVTRLPDGTCRVVLEGLGRVRLGPLSTTGGEDDPYHADVTLLVPCEAAPARAAEAADLEGEAQARGVVRLFEEYARLNERIPEELPSTVTEARDRVRLAHLVAGHLLVPHVEKQEALEATDAAEQLEVLRQLLVRELEILQIEEKLDQQIRLQMDSDRRHHYLHEQLRAIRQELGSEEPADDWSDLDDALASRDLPPHARERAEREMGRLRKLNPVAPEAAVIRTYLDWILELPWTRRTDDNLDVAHAARVLDDAHFGLSEVKERILDHIAVLSLVGELQGPILCLVGPPGVGKTSLGRSIAQAVGREFVRVSLGGVRDEAEIRGHRRTYVGALPGRIVQGMRRSGTKNPVFLLDEVDKLARDFHGDPGAALLEVLDPEQNRTFTDHYLELEFDLSDVLFVATANTLQGVPEPLRDRMEVIRLPGYLDTEKRTIARRFLWPRQASRHGLEQDVVTLEDGALDAIIDRYTREAGVRDEAEIRGHRRTYVGALPGRIVQGMRKSGTKNPVFLLDEVDKLARDFHGDPGAALLEVLDPEQNRAFTDHYLELEFDLSDVLFVATANTLQGVPEPLRDRMEVIRLPGYLDTEKRTIARRFLWPRQASRHGLEQDVVTLEDGALDAIIDRYTREAGVRELERRISRIARKVARRVAEEEGSVRERRERSVGDADLRTLLGPPPYLPPEREEGLERCGIANGLAWTAAGGEVLDVEVAVVPGSGEVRLTGTLGEVMKESAMAAVTYARSRATRLGLDPRFHRDVDVHIHIPEGATPKDGPSAGITIASALISALTDTPSRADVAMTGEITLRGRVLGVGGVKEKAVAALRNGVRCVILPAANLPDLELLPDEVREGVEFVAVRTMDEVLQAALAPSPGARGTGSGKDAVRGMLGGSELGVQVS